MFKIVWSVILGFFIFLAQGQGLSSGQKRSLEGPPVPLKVVDMVNFSARGCLKKMIVLKNVGNEDVVAKWNISCVDENLSKKDSISFFALEHEIRPGELDTLTVVFKEKTGSCSVPLMIFGSLGFWRVDFTIDQCGLKGVLAGFSRK